VLAAVTEQEEETTPSRARDWFAGAYVLYLSWSPGVDSAKAGEGGSEILTRLEKARNADPGLFWVDYIHGLVQLALERPVPAAVALSRVEAATASPVVKYLLGIAAAMRKDQDEAVRRLEDAIPGLRSGRARCRALHWLRESRAVRAKPEDIAALPRILESWRRAAQDLRSWIDILAAGVATADYHHSRGDQKAEILTLEEVAAFENVEQGQASAVIYDRLASLYEALGDDEKSESAARKGERLRIFEDRGEAGPVRPYGLQLMFGLRDVERPRRMAFHPPGDVVPKD
jgi:hypothetical protein